MSEQPPYRQPGSHGRPDEPTEMYPRASSDSEPTRVYRQGDTSYGPSGYGQAPPDRGRGWDDGRPPYGDDRRLDPRSDRRPPSPAEMRRRSLDPGALWSGGVVTAIVAALVALAGIIIIRGILHIGILTSLSVGTFGDAKTVYVVVSAFVAALVATAILHALLLTTPQPVTFFSWIAALVTVIVALLPLTTTAPWQQKLATVVLDVVIGLVIGLLLSGAARRARRDPAQAPPRR